ncbi:hypothetical protein ACWFPY_23635 [Nocardia fluminea]
MAEQPSNPHDAFARHILGRTVNAASELRAVLRLVFDQYVDDGVVAVRPRTAGRCNATAVAVRRNYPGATEGVPVRPLHNVFR